MEGLCIHGVSPKCRCLKCQPLTVWERRDMAARAARIERSRERRLAARQALKDKS